MGGRVGGGMGGRVDGWVYEAYEVKKKGKNYAVFYFAGKRKYLFYIYDVITSPEKEKRPTIHY